ncbi:BrxA/BrxB family bacilliredoxin [Planococcus salinarum]|uniref:BrxA/BrxB family bacilliredoxin n=1 Tax=Planococcus salinarum TaxID=622695 RepID=UPI000E3E4AD8|nr:BrxA/BrxB family bacilliredoxin [Planococcus salinarum]TAA72315.1 BrxA/BrxB family bacilliredoxin [Planococcus salinarum]
MNAYDEYMKGIVTPMRKELTNHGFKELLTAEEVNDHISKAEGTTVAVINSVCGCAAGLARPGVIEALNKTAAKPDHLVTVFAGQDKEATAQMRSYFEDVPPSSPSIAVLKDGKLAYIIPREKIEDHSVEDIRDHLVQALEQAAQ